jgi:predicted dehydrogenase
MAANVPGNVSASSRPASGAKLVKVGVIGLSERANSFARAAANSDKLKIIAGFSRSPELRRAFQLETRLPVVSDLKTLLSYPMLDGVILAVPADQQLAIAAEAATAKKHLFIAGAVGRTFEEGFEIASLEQKHGIAITAAHTMRLLGPIRAIRSAIDKNELGTLALIEATFSGPSGLCHSEPADGEQADIDGPFSDAAMQLFDLLQFLGGEIAEVSAMSSGGSREHAPVDTQITTLFKFADGKLGYAGSSSTSAGVFAVRVLGSKGVIHFEADMDAWKNPEKLDESSTLYVQRGDAGYAKRENLSIPATDAFAAQLEIFAEACRTGRSGEFSVAKANAAAAVVEAALRSLDRRGQSVRVADTFRSTQSRMRQPTPVVQNA